MAKEPTEVTCAEIVERLEIKLGKANTSISILEIQIQKLLAELDQQDERTLDD